MKTSARQNVVAAVETIKIADLASGVSVDLFTQLPNGTLPIALHLIVVDPSDAGTSDVLDVGITGSLNAYIDDANLKSAAGTTIKATAVPGLVANSATGGGLQLKATRTAAGTAATKGEFRAVLLYVREGVEDFSEG